MEFCLTNCCEMIEKLESKLNEERNKNTSNEILELYEDLLMDVYKFVEKNLEEFI